MAMVLRRGAARRQRRPRRRFFKGQGVKRIVRRAFNALVERKHHNLTFAYANLPVAPTVSVADFCAIPQGLLDINRVGDRAMIKKLIIRIVMERQQWQVAGGAPLGRATTKIRLVFVQWKPNTVPVALDILNIGPSGGVDYLSEYNHDTRQEYTILKDKTWPLTPVTNLISIVRTFSFFGKKLSKKIQFVNAGTVGTNKIYMFVITDSVATAEITMSFQARLYFTDA